MREARTVTKIHCAGDGAVRDTLDAIDVVRSFNGPGRMHQIAHAGFIDPADIPRFKSLDVIADLSPIIWYPSPIIEAIQAAIPERRSSRYWPNATSWRRAYCWRRVRTGRLFPIPTLGLGSKEWSLAKIRREAFPGRYGRSKHWISRMSSRFIPGTRRELPAWTSLQAP